MRNQKSAEIAVPQFPFFGLYRLRWVTTIDSKIQTRAAKKLVFVATASEGAIDFPSKHAMPEGMT